MRWIIAAVVIVLVVVGVYLFLDSKRMALQSCPGPVPPIVITCGPAPHAEDVCANEDVELEWDTRGIGNGVTVNLHDFKLKRKYWFDKKESPFVTDPAPGNNQNNMKAKIKVFQKKEGQEV